MDYIFSKRKQKIGDRGFIIGNRFILTGKDNNFSEIRKMNPVFCFSKFSGNLFEDIIGGNNLSFYQKDDRGIYRYIPERDFGLNYPCCLVGISSIHNIYFSNNNIAFLFWQTTSKSFLTEAKYLGETYQGFYCNKPSDSIVFTIVNFDSRSQGQIYFDNVLQTNKYGDGGNFDNKPRNMFGFKDDSKFFQIIGFNRKLNEQERNILFERYQKLNLSL